MADCMSFPDDWREFLRFYSFKDEEEVYTNGSELIPVFRVVQLIGHLLSEKPARVLTLDEAIGAEVNEGGPLYFESKNEKPIYVADAVRADDYAFAKIDIWGRLHRKYLLSEYGRYWRMWSAKPTEEQRAAAKWEE